MSLKYGPRLVKASQSVGDILYPVDANVQECGKHIFTVNYGDVSPHKYETKKAGN